MEGIVQGTKISRDVGGSLLNTRPKLGGLIDRYVYTMLSHHSFHMEFGGLETQSYSIIN